MNEREILKGKTLYKNGLEVVQPEFTDAKLQEDLKFLSALDKSFSEIEGQDYACQAVKEYLFGNLRKANKDGPAAVLLFVGPPAVGKTLLAKKIAEALGRPFERFDMSSYSDREATFSLFGLNRSYRAAEPGRLTKFLKEHPVSVLLFDEIEKAHATVHNNLLQMLERGCVRDLFYERDFSVRDCILIFTSNMGSNVYNTGNPYNLSVTPIATVIKALEEERSPITLEPYFPRELVSRFASGKIIVFNRLRPEVLHRIAVRHIEAWCRYYYTEYNISCRLDADVLADIILFSQGGNADVRMVVRAVQELFLKNFERVVRTVNDMGGGGKICGIRYNIELASAAANAAEILGDNGLERILVFGESIACGIPKKDDAHTEIITVNESLSCCAIKKLDPAIALIGVDKKNESRAKDLFDALIAVGVPTYVYTGKDAVPLIYFAENGAVDCYAPGMKTRDFRNWLSGVVRVINFIRVTEKLFRTNKIISYVTSYTYKKRTCVAEVTLSGFTLQIAYGNGESTLFAGAASIPDVTFETIIGADEAKREFEPVIRQLKNYASYKRNGIRIPRGIILDGPPGCGKTTLAKAVANAAELPFISLNATEFLSKWVGEGERKIRDIFAAARRYAPSIIFIDEIDCIVKDRTGSAAISAHTDSLTNALLSELDGFSTENSAPVFVIAATNFDVQASETKLDKAFLRRFDKKIHIDLPKEADRERYLSRELGKFDFCAVSQRTIENIAKRSVGWSLADLELVVQNAVRHSESDGNFSLTDQILEEAFASFAGGGRKIYDEQVIRKTAYHEAGHAVVAALLGLKPAYVTIAARNGYGGYVQYGEEDKFDLSREECLNRICAAMAGRAGEVCFYGDGGVTTGAGGDIRAATEMARRMVCSYGMERDMLCYIERDETAEKADVGMRVQEILAEQYERALRLVRDNTCKVEAVAKALLERESLTDRELSEILSDR